MRIFDEKVFKINEKFMSSNFEELRKQTKTSVAKRNSNLDSGHKKPELKKKPMRRLR